MIDAYSPQVEWLHRTHDPMASKTRTPHLCLDNHQQARRPHPLTQLHSFFRTSLLLLSVTAISVNPFSSPRAIYSATASADSGLFPRISSSPRSAHSVVPYPTTPSSHFSLPSALATPNHIPNGGVDLQYATAQGVEAGHPQWSFLANDPELFAWARSFLNDELDITMPGATFS